MSFSPNHTRTSCLPQLSGQNQTSSPHLNQDWVAVGRVLSRAASCPGDQQGKYTSPGRYCVSGIRFFCSPTGDRLAALRKFCPLGGRIAKSYRPAHDMQQHDHRVYPNILFYNRDTSFLFHIWEAPILFFTAARNSFGKRWRPRASMGAAANHAPY